MHKKDNFLHLILKLLGTSEPGTDLDFVTAMITMSLKFLFLP